MVGSRCGFEFAPGHRGQAAISGQPQGTPAGRKARHVSSAVADVNPMRSAVCADVDAIEATCHDLVGPVRMELDARPVPWAFTFGQQRPVFTAVGGHNQISSVVLGMLPVSTDGQTRSALRDGRAKNACHGFTLSDRKVDGAPRCPAVCAFQATRGHTSCEDPRGVSVDADVAVRCGKTRFAFGVRGNEVAACRCPRMTSVTRDQQRQTAVHRVSKYEAFLVVPPSHGVEEHRRTGVVMHPCWLKSIWLTFGDPCRRGDGGCEPMLAVERRRPKRWDGAVRSSPLNVLPVVARRGGLAYPT